MLRRASYAVSVQFRPLNSSSFVAQTHSYVRWQSAKRIAEIRAIQNFARGDDKDSARGHDGDTKGHFSSVDALADMIGVQDKGLIRSQCFIGGAWTDADDGDTIAVVNPATGLEILRVPKMGRTETDRAITCASDAMTLWSKLTASKRASILHRWYRLILDHGDDLARIMVAEQGKPMLEAKGEVVYAASFVEWFAEEARRAYGEVIPTHDLDTRVFATRQPVGVCAAITPWNFPLAMITRKAAAALAAGCSVVVKPSEETPLSAFALGVLAERAGIPAGVIQFVTGDYEAIGDALTESDVVRKLSFTGSTEVGKKLNAKCAATVKNVSLELGGNAPFIVFPDANIDAAVDGAIMSKFRNSGQTCVCAQRFIVHEKVVEEFATKFAAKAKQLAVGDGSKGETDQGPLINADAMRKVESHVEDAVKKGAVVLCGGERMVFEHAKGGHFYAPTVLVECDSTMKVFTEETFGPVAAIATFTTEDEAIRMANKTRAGLASYVFTRDNATLWRVSEALQYGIVGANTGIISTASAPFGGMRESGIGREGGKHGLEEYLEVKYVCMAGLGDKKNPW